MLRYLDLKSSWGKGIRKKEKKLKLYSSYLHYFMISGLNILFQTVDGLIYLTWLFKSDLKRVISSCVLILCLRVGSFVMYVSICKRRKGMGTQGHYNPKWLIVHRPF